MPGPDHLSGTAQLEVHLCNPEAIVRLTHYFQSPARFRVGFHVPHKDAHGLRGAAPDPPPKLVQLGKSKAFRVFDDHESCVGNIDADLYDRSRDQDLNFATRKCSHPLLLFGALHAPMEKTDPQVGKNFRLKIFGHFGGSAQVRFFRFLHQGINHIRLVPGIYRPPDFTKSLPSVFLFVRQRFDRFSAGRHLINNGDVQISVKRQRKRARDRGGSHDKDVRIFSFLLQDVSLNDTEPVLFVDHHQGKVFEFDIFLD